VGTERKFSECIMGLGKNPHRVITYFPYVFLKIVFGLPYAIGMLSVLSVCNVGVLWPNGCMDQFKVKLGMDAGFGAGHIVLDGNPAPLQRGTAPNFRPCLLTPTAGWIKMPHGTAVGLGPGDTVHN